MGEKVWHGAAGTATSTRGGAGRCNQSTIGALATSSTMFVAEDTADQVEDPRHATASTSLGRAGRFIVPMSFLFHDGALAPRSPVR